jgi:hypothetical protein
MRAGTERLRRVTRRIARRVDLTPLARWRGGGTPPGIRTAKTTLAFERLAEDAMTGLFTGPVIVLVSVG